jgi:PAS domain S-box-containing protein
MARGQPEGPMPKTVARRVDGFSRGSALDAPSFSEERAGQEGAFFATVLDTLSQGIAAFDADLRLKLFNRSYVDLFEYPRGFVRIGMGFEDILRFNVRRGEFGAGLDPEEYIRGAFKRAHDGSRFRRGEHVRPNGTVIALRRDAVDGGGFINTYTDITRRKQAEAVARQNEDRMRAILDRAVDGIIAIGAHGTILSMNKAAEQIFGYEEMELAGKKAHVLIPFIETWTAEERSSESREAMGCRKDVTPVPLEVSFAHANFDSEEVDILIVRDITRHKEMQAQLVHTSKLATMGQMAAGLAHEMNQPLNVMRMAADNLLLRMERGRNDADYLRENLELIGEQAERVGKMTMHLRVFARLDAQNLESFDPAVSARAAADLMERQLALANILFETDIPEHCAPVLGHSNQLEQVIINLISNAHDAILDFPRPQKDAYVGRITLRLSEDAARRTATIRIRDTGGGIPHHIRDRIFDPFFTTKEVGRGTGLGLSISSTIIAEMKGKIAIKDTPDGTEMVVTVPTCVEERTP